MAEILLSLTIIGVVAAITLPSLTGNINERTWNTQRKALYSRFSQAIALMPALNGYGNFVEESSSGAGDGVDNVAETFVTSGLSKVIKINNICAPGSLADCGIPSKILPLTGTGNITFPEDVRGLNTTNVSWYNSWSASGTTPAGSNSYSNINTKAVAFETANGESVALYYNPRCQGAMGQTVNYYTQAKVCVNMVYDLNGTKGPNTVNKDIGFITVFYPSDSVVVAPIPAVQDAASSIAYTEATGKCKEQDEDYRVPTLLELAALSYNANLIPGFSEKSHWSSTILSSSQVLYLEQTGAVRNYYNNVAKPLRCIKH